MLHHPLFKKALLLYALFGSFTLLVATIDVAAIGPAHTNVGLSTINRWVYQALGSHRLWDTLSDIPLLLALLIAGVHAVEGLLQWRRRRHLTAVDAPILALGLCYGATALCNQFFEALALNPRPMLVEGLLESGYPSTHVLLVTVIIGCEWYYQRNAKHPFSRQCRGTMAMGLIAWTAIGRLLAGMHWCSDIVGALLLAGAIVATYGAWLAHHNNL